MVTQSELQKLIREHGEAKDTISLGDDVLGVGTYQGRKFIEHAKVVDINDQSATLKPILRIYVDNAEQPTGTWDFQEDEDNILNVPFSQFRKSIEERLRED